MIFNNVRAPFARNTGWSTWYLTFAGLALHEVFILWFLIGKILKKRHAQMLAIGLWPNFLQIGACLWGVHPRCIRDFISSNDFRLLMRLVTLSNRPWIPMA